MQHATYRLTTKQLLSFALLAACCGAALFHAIPDFRATASVAAQSKPTMPTGVKEKKKMQLGAFSISLAVKNLEASKAFYEKFGFSVFGGNQAQKYLIMKNGDAIIGLFQGMFDKNILTFNPGWDSNAQPLAEFTDVRELQRQLKAQGVAFATQADENTKGPASFVVNDPDGNPILIDQHR